MATVTEGNNLGDLLMTEVKEGWTRQKRTITGAASLLLGTVLAALTVGAASSAAKTGGNTGNGTLTLDATAPKLAGVTPGVYAVRCITAAANGGTFRVEAPNGVVLGDVAVGDTFADQVKFVIADGAADFIVGDGFDITVAAGSGKYQAIDFAGTGGAEKAVAVLAEDVDASLADQPGIVIARGAVVNSSALVWPAGATTDQKNAALAQLEALGIVSVAAL